MAILLNGSKKDLEGFQVTRILPNIAKRMVGPFIFLDHMGPVNFPAGEGIDVRPHPHIGLATLTYLLEGSLLHRDSLGNNLEILPGDVNWMTAGQGIVHSERETIEVKAREHRLNGIQCWIALPESMSAIEPNFHHIKRCELPHHMHDHIYKRLIAGEAYGMTSPLKSYSPMFYLDILAKANKTFERPNPGQECMLYVLEGTIKIDSKPYGPGQILIFEEEKEITTIENSRVLLLGGESWDRTPFIHWNFVSFDKTRIEQAKEAWREGSFPDIPGDNAEYAPLPE